MTEPSLVIDNAKIVLAETVIDGWLAIEDGLITAIGRGRAPSPGLDLDGDYLLPGFVELHTDHLEAHAVPRPHVHWDPQAAVLAYDRQIIASGITTVFDSLRVGSVADKDELTAELETFATAIATLQGHGLLRAEHRTHLRCEIATPDVVGSVTAFLDARPAHLISLMDHTPGQRQFRDLDKMRSYYGRHYGLAEDKAFAAFVEQRRAMHHTHAAVNRRALVALAQARGVSIASHDDATAEHVEESCADKVAIAEFPTTMEAAAGSHAAGIKVLMGAPNIVRGGSHSGNVAAEDLAAAGTLDILSSDYVPAALMMAVFDLPRRIPRIDLAAAVRLVSLNPAEATGLDDRGAIAPGKRADLVHVRMRGHAPATLQVWQAGRRVG